MTKDSHGQDGINLSVERRLTRAEVILYYLMVMTTMSVAGIRFIDPYYIFNHLGWP